MRRSVQAAGGGPGGGKGGRTRPSLRSRAGQHLTAHLAVKCLKANYCIRWRGLFKGLSRDGGRAEFSKRPPRFLFDDDLSNEPNFGRIHLAGQYSTDVPKRFFLIFFLVGRIWILEAKTLRIRTRNTAF